MSDLDTLRAAREHVRDRLDAGDKAEEIILGLVREHGARFGETHRTYQLTVAGVNEISDVGPISLLRAWLVKANAELRIPA